MNKHLSDYCMGYDDASKDMQKEIERLNAALTEIRDSARAYHIEYRHDGYDQIAELAAAAVGRRQND